MKTKQLQNAKIDVISLSNFLEALYTLSKRVDLERLKESEKKANKGEFVEVSFDDCYN